MSYSGANYFAVDDEELLEQESSLQTNSLSWRGDPSTNWSDWTVVITAPSSSGVESTQTYHVHRNILAAGLRKCDYFATLFHTQAAMAEQQDHTSRITLSESDAAVFDNMLDFCYNQGSLNVTVQNVVPLRSVARYFQCRELMRHVNEFVRRDLTKETAVLYLRNAYMRDEKLEMAARKLLCEAIHEIPLCCMDTLPTRLFESVVCNSEDIPLEHHRHVSRHIKSFLDVNPDELSTTLLLKLTAHLTEIDKTVAHGFLDLMQRLDVTNEKEHLALDNLAQLCATALAPEWKDLDTTQHGMQRFINPKGDYRGTARCVVPLLEKSLKRAQEDYQSAKDECAVLYQQNQILKRKVTALMSQVSAVQTQRAFQQHLDDSDDDSSVFSSSSSSSSEDDDEEDDSSDSDMSDW
jgi:hypothetical protein